jgi:hypothetical protein
LTELVAAVDTAAGCCPWFWFLGQNQKAQTAPMRIMVNSIQLFLMYVFTLWFLSLFVFV